MNIKSSFNPQLYGMIDELILLLKKRIQFKQVDIIFLDANKELNSWYSFDYSKSIKEVILYCIENKKSFSILKNRHYSSLAKTKFVNIKPTKTFFAIKISSKETACLYTDRESERSTAHISDIKFLRLFSNGIMKIIKENTKLNTPTKDLKDISGMVAQITESSKVLLKSRELRDRIISITKFFNLIQTSTDPNVLIKNILSNAKATLYTQSASLFMFDRETNAFHFQFVTDDKIEEGTLVGSKIPKGKGIVNICAQTKKPIIVNNAVKDTRVYQEAFKPLLENEINIKQKQVKNLMAAPLLLDGECIGVIEVINRLNGNYFSKEDLRIFLSIAHSISISIHKSRILHRLEKELREVTILHTVADIVATSDNSKELLHRFLSGIEKYFGVYYQCVLLYDGATKDFVIEDIQSFSREKVWEIFPATFINHIFKEGKSLVISNIKNSKEYGMFFGEGHDPKYSSYIILALQGSKDYNYKGGLFCLAQESPKEFDQDDFYLLSTMTSELSQGYRSFIMEEEILEQRELNREIEIASQFQKDILPSVTPDHDFVEIKTLSVMSASVGGDFYYTYAKTPQSPVNLLIGDVSGKSFPAALFMAISSTVLKTIIQTKVSPDDILTNANKILFKESKRGMFSTLFLAKYYPKTSILQYASAGHNQMILLRADKSHVILSSKGLPLGVDYNPKQKYSKKEIRVHPEDVLILYTDGVTEALNDKNEEFGLVRLLSFLKNSKYKNTEDLVNKLFDSVTEFCNYKTRALSDDIAIVICRFKSILKIQKYQSRWPIKKNTVNGMIEETEKIIYANHHLSKYRNDIILIVEEVVINILTHAYGDVQKEEKELRYKFQIEDNKKVMIEFEDQGKCYDFYNVKSSDARTVLETNIIGGFGVRLINAISDKIEYVYVDGKNILRVEKNLTED